ncbi:MAG: diguanylate cyclase (GGDEF)-like protein [Gammaproteobacteria bacterium]|jgi:diguanylate cyclase (GGDEF)-like protein
MAECNYYSFNALAKISDPELLYIAFEKQIAPGHTDKLDLTIYEHEDNQWSRLTPRGTIDRSIEPSMLEILEAEIYASDKDIWLYNTEHEAWFCSYRPLSSKLFVLFFKTQNPNALIEEEYIQFLFHFYCHQLQVLQGTYRDALTGLYNRRAFNEKLDQLHSKTDQFKRRAVNFVPSIYVMVDIDHFKLINDTKGHLFGDEVLRSLAQIMIDSFRENDLLFRYGGEEFSIILMDITNEQAMQSLQRFRQRVADYDFGDIGQVTISIGFTKFDREISGNEVIKQADNALYYCKATTRNAVHDYHHLTAEKLIPLQKAAQPAITELH